MYEGKEPESVATIVMMTEVISYDQFRYGRLLSIVAGFGTVCPIS